MKVYIGKDELVKGAQTASDGIRTALAALWFAAAVAAGGARAVELPPDYQFLEYVETTSTGKQYLDTTYAPFTATCGIYADIQLTKLSTSDPVAYGTLSPNRCLGCSGTWSYGWKQNGTGSDGNLGSTDLDRHVFKQNFYNSGIIIMDDDPDRSATLPTGVTSSNPNSVYVGCSHYSYAYGSQPMRIYGVKLTSDATTLVADFRPAKDGDGVACLFDMVRGTTHYSKSSTAFEAGPNLDLSDELTVAGTPAEGGVVSPDYGTHDGYTVGQTLTASASSVWTNNEEDVAAACAGYKVFTNDVVMTSGSSNSFVYTHPYSPLGVRLEWQWNLSYKVTSVAGVTVSSNWVARGATVKLTATTQAGQWVRWVDSVSGTIYGGNPLTVKVCAPMNLTPAFGTLYHVDANGSDETTTGTSRETAFKTIGKALEKCEDGDAIEVWASADPYDVTASVVISNAVTVFGSSGNPDDVVIRRKGTAQDGFPNVRLDHAEAVLKDVTVANGYQKTYQTGSGGVDITANGGSLIHCVVRGCRSVSYNWGGGVYIAADSSGLVDCCVISNCTNEINNDACGGSAVNMRGGTVRNSFFVGNNVSGSAAPGGTVRISGGVLENCTIAGNAGGLCSGVYAASAAARVRNCVIANNTSTGTTVPSEINWAGASASFANCLSDAAINAACLVETNIFDSVWTGDYRPKVGSKAIDAATQESWMAGAEDLDGNARVSGTAADIGAYERDSAAAAVSASASATEGLAPLNVTFTVRTQNLTGDLSYRFDWKGDGTDVSTETSPTVVKSLAAGEYRVRVSVVSGGETYWAPGYIRISVASNEIVVNPGESISAAIDSAQAGSEIVLKTGTHECTAQILVEKGVTLRGETGRPEDVVVRSKNKSCRVFLLNHADAVLKDVVVADGYNNASYGNFDSPGVTIGSFGGTLFNCVVRGCSGKSYSRGGGIRIVDKAPAFVDCCVVSNCSIESSQGTAYGGSAVNMQSGTVRNSLFVNNTCVGDTEQGGTVRILGGTLENCTIADNRSGKCAGVYATGTSTVRNCIISDNTSTGTTVPSGIVFAGSTSLCANCLADAWINANCLVETQALESVWARLYQPKVGSMAIDAATSESWQSAAKDLVGNARVSGTAADIGAYERDSAAAAASVAPSVTEGFSPLSVTFTVKTQNIAGDLSYRFDWKGDGTDVTTETSSTVARSFASGTYCVKVSVVSGGTTYPVPGYVRIASIPKEIEVTPGESIADAIVQSVAGGEIVLKTGTHECTAQILVDKGVTVRGETGNPADVVVRSKDKNCGVFKINHANAILRDLVVADGYQSWSYAASGITLGVNGGTVSNCVVRGCSGTVYCRGGGIYIEEKSPGLVDCCVVSNCTTAISYDSDAYGGSAIHMRSGTVRNTLCTGNTMKGAAAAGGTVRMLGGTLENCTIAGNWGKVCSGVRVTGTTAIVRNCIVSSNVTDSATAADRVFSGGTDCIQTTVVDVDIAAAGTVVESPAETFRRPERGDWRLKSSSKAVSYGTYYPWMDTARDLMGNPRIRGKKPDAGCYEAMSGGFTLIMR